MQCPGCANSDIVGAVPANDGSGDYVPCPLCSPFGTPGNYPGAGISNPIEIEFSLANAQPVLSSILMRPSYDFLWMRAIAVRTGSFRSLIQINQLQVQTVYSQQGNPLPTTGLSDANFWGTNSNPFPLSNPIPIRANDHLDITLTDTSGVFPNVISLLLDGAAFPPGSLPARFGQTSNGSGATGQ